MTTTAEEMAIAVLRGDAVAARALADELCQQTSETSRPLPPVQKITCDWSRLRVVVYLKDEVCREGELADDFQQQTERAVFGWLRGRDPESAEVLVLTMIDRVELFELPADWKRPEGDVTGVVGGVTAADVRGMVEEARQVGALPNEPPAFDLGGGPPSASARLGRLLAAGHAAGIERAILGLPLTATDAEVAAEIERFRIGDPDSRTVEVPTDYVDRRLARAHADPFIGETEEHYRRRIVEIHPDEWTEEPTLYDDEVS